MLDHKRLVAVIGLGVVTGVCVAAFVGIWIVMFVAGENMKTINS